MSFQRTAAHSSRITKPSKRRSLASPLSAAKRKRPSQPLSRIDDVADLVPNDRLEDHGILASLAADIRFSDVAQQMAHIQSNMFADVPERGAGMNSVRIAEVLNFRRSLPPVVSAAHVHALATSPTAIEKEIARLTQVGVTRKIKIPGRGIGADAVGEGLVLVEDWEKLIRLDGHLSDETKLKYSGALAHPADPPTFAPAEITALMRAGFLTGATALHPANEALLRPGASTTGTLATVSSAGATHISGTVEAAAQGSRDHISGGSGSSDRLSSASSVVARASPHYVFSLPNMGPYLRLLTDARNHLVSLLAKSSRYHEMPKDLLKERWDGGIMGSDDASTAAKARGEFRGVLPGRTKKWKQFYGLEFDWVLEECLGAGLVECFKTGSVGIGVRLLR